MTRISTADSWASALYNLQLAQAKQQDAGNQLSTQKVATDFTGYGQASQTLISMNNQSTRLEGFTSNLETVTRQLDTQGQALQSFADNMSAAKNSILQAIAAGKGDGLMTNLSTQFSLVAGALNTQFDGDYVFGGGIAGSPPLTTYDINTLANPTPPASGYFQNGTLISSARVSETTTLTTGFLANSIGTNSVSAFQLVAQFNAGQTVTVGGQTFAGSAFNGPLSQTQTSFLQAMTAQFSQGFNDANTANSNNGTTNAQAVSIQKSVQNQLDAVNTMITKKTGVDLATAYSNSQQAAVAVQASARVISQLNDASLLNYLK